MYRQYKQLKHNKLDTIKITKNTKYYVINPSFTNWIDKLKKLECVKYVDSINNIISPDAIIISLSGTNMTISDPRIIIQPDIKLVDMLNNKCKFGMFMMDNFIEYIPQIIYMSFEEENLLYYNNQYNHDINIKMISRPAIGFAGLMVRIINNIDMTEKNIIVSKYIQHTEYYTGHLLVICGKIIKQIYFKCTTDDPNHIQRGSVTNYQILTINQLDCSTSSKSIFSKIFKKLNYTGFANADFIIHNFQILIFEINPRPGGSLIYNEQYSNEFFNTMITYYENNVKKY
jgi:predicted ATP-grasp superfamily ATP-dependent carboligase